MKWLRGWLSEIWEALKSIFRAQNVSPLKSPIGPRPVYVYMDEAGDLDFGKTGSRFFLCGVLVAYDPWPLMHALARVREKAFKGGFIPQAFHAAEDKQRIRDMVFQAIVETGGFDVHVFVMHKQDVPATHREQLRFYTFVTDFALRMVLLRHPTEEPIYIITDALPVNSKRGAIVKGLKTSLAAVVPGRQFEIEHHSSGTQACLQVIDYITWAVFRRLERSDERSYVLIKDFVKQELRLDWRLVT